MATRTRYYNLTKPEGIDLVNIEDLNGNFDVIDLHLKENEDAIDGKQDTLSFDTTPTRGSGNPVTSGGIHEALQGKQDTLSFDGTPTAESTSPVTSGGIKTALDGKQDTLTFDTMPRAGSSNPVTSDGISTALSGKQNDLTQAPVVSTLLDTDYLFLERSGTIYKIRASAIVIPSEDDGIETEGGDALLTEDGQEILLDDGDEEPGAVTTQSGEPLLTENNDPITIDQ